MTNRKIQKKQTGETDSNNLSTIERIAYVNLFTDKIIDKVLKAKILNDDEVFSLKEVSRIISAIASGWENAGQKRTKNPTREALYLRQNRARKRLEEAKKSGSRIFLIDQIEKEYNDAKIEYEQFMIEDNKRTGRK